MQNIFKYTLYGWTIVRQIITTPFNNINSHNQQLCFAAISHLSETLGKQKIVSTKTYPLWVVIGRF